MTEAENLLNELPPEAIDASQTDDSISNIETTPSMEGLLRQAELRAEEHHDAWLRARAEVDNVRRRGIEDADKARKYAAEKFASDLLAVKDSLEAALASVETVTVEGMKEGVDATLKQLVGVFERHQVETVSPLGQKFDPNLHQAIGVMPAAGPSQGGHCSPSGGGERGAPSGEGETNTVAQVLQKGYLLNGRVLRPALVMVYQ